MSRLSDSSIQSWFILLLLSFHRPSLEGKLRSTVSIGPESCIFGNDNLNCYANSSL